MLLHDAKLLLFFFAKYVSGPQVFCEFRLHDSSEKGIDCSRSSTIIYRGACMTVN